MTLQAFYDMVHWLVWRARWSRERLAGAMKCSEATVGRWLQRGSPPSESRRRRLARLYERALAEIAVSRPTIVPVEYFQTVATTGPTNLTFRERIAQQLELALRLAETSGAGSAVDAGERDVLLILPIPPDGEAPQAHLLEAVFGSRGVAVILYDERLEGAAKNEQIVKMVLRWLAIQPTPANDATPVHAILSASGAQS